MATAKTPKAAPAKKAATKATDTKAEFNPTVRDTGKLDHTTCGHPSTPKARAACRAARKATK